METYMYFIDNYSNLDRRSWKYAVQWGGMGIKRVEMSTETQQGREKKQRKTNLKDEDWIPKSHSGNSRESQRWRLNPKESLWE